MLKYKNCVLYIWIPKKRLCPSYTEAASMSFFSQSFSSFFCNHRKLLIVSTYYPIEVLSFKDRDGVIELYPIGSLSRSMIAYLNALYTIGKCMLIRQTLYKCVYKVLCLEELIFKIDKDKSIRNKRFSKWVTYSELHYWVIHEGKKYFTVTETRN